MAKPASKKNAGKKAASKKRVAQKTTAKQATSSRPGNSNELPVGSKKNTKVRTAAILIAGIVVMAALLVLNAGSLAKVAVEKVASDTLGVKVTLASLDVNLQDREVGVGGIAVANPEGYQGTNAVVVDTVHIAAEEISQNLLVLDEIRVSGSRINLEVDRHKTNLIDIHNNLDGKASQRDAGQPPVKVIINKLVIEGATLQPAVTLAGEPMQPVTLPDIRIFGIGESTGGMLASEAMVLITDRIVIVAMQAAVEKGYLRGMEQESLKQIQNALGLPSGLADQVRGFGEKVRSLFAD